MNDPDLRAVPDRGAALASRLGSELASHGVAALLVLATSNRDPDLAAFVGSAHLGKSFVIVPAPGRGRPGAHLGYLTPMERAGAATTGLSLLTPEELGLGRLARKCSQPVDLWQALLERAFELVALPPGRIAIAGHLDAGIVASLTQRMASDGWSLVSGHEFVRRLRKTKNEAELAAVRRAAAGTEAAFRRCAEILRATEPAAGASVSELLFQGERLRVGHLRSAVAEVMARHRLEQPEGNIMAPAEQGAVPHHTGDDDRPLRAGEALVVDLFPRGELFADCTRTFCVGTPSDALQRAHEATLSALQKAHDRAQAGVHGWDLQIATCEHFAELGYENPIDHPGTLTGYVHGLGHGVGYELHELPLFREEAGDDGLLAVGDVVTLEPGLYNEEARFGVRLEDLVVVESDRLDVLIDLPYALDPRAW